MQAIMADETPVVFDNPGRLILHLIPLESFSSNYQINPADLATLDDRMFLFSDNRVGSGRFNLDGYFASDSAGDLPADYTQVYRNGIIESVTLEATGKIPKSADNTQRFYNDYVQNLISAAYHFATVQKKFGGSEPIRCFVSFVGVKGLYLTQQSRWHRTGHRMDRDNLLFAEVDVANLTVEECGTRMRPIFDQLWNAGGKECCPLYDKDGTWKVFSIDVPSGSSFRRRPTSWNRDDEFSSS